MDSKKTVNILILCANNQTAALKQPKLQNIIDYLIKNYFSNTLNNKYPTQQVYYMGFNLTTNLENKKCESTVDDMVKNCKYKEYIFDIILSEYCPVRTNASIFSNIFFENIKYLLSDNGIVSWIEAPYNDYIKYNYSYIENNNTIIDYNLKEFYDMLYTKYKLKYIESYNLATSIDNYNYCIIKKESQSVLHKTYNLMQTVSNKNVTSTPAKNINPMNKSKIAHTKGIGLSYQTLLNSIYFIKY